MGNEQEKQAKIIVNKRGLQSYTVGWLNYIAEWSGITKEDVDEEILRMKSMWQIIQSGYDEEILDEIIGRERAGKRSRQRN